MVCGIKVNDKIHKIVRQFNIDFEEQSTSKVIPENKLSIEPTVEQVVQFRIIHT